jgi:heme oxygenase (mycobilin-producing)
MLVVTRHRVGPADCAPEPAAVEQFLTSAQAAAAVLAERPGCLSVEVVRALDDGAMFMVVSRWLDVGSYRRALSRFEVKVGAVPLLATAEHEPSAFEVLVSATADGGVQRSTGDLAPTAHVDGPA